MQLRNRHRLNAGYSPAVPPLPPLPGGGCTRHASPAPSRRCRSRPGIPRLLFLPGTLAMRGHRHKHGHEKGERFPAPLRIAGAQVIPRRQWRRLSVCWHHAPKSPQSPIDSEPRTIRRRHRSLRDAFAPGKRSPFAPPGSYCPLLAHRGARPLRRGQLRGLPVGRRGRGDCRSG